MIGLVFYLLGLGFRKINDLLHKILFGSLLVATKLVLLYDATIPAPINYFPEAAAHL